MFLPGNPGGRLYTLLFGGIRKRSLAHRLAIGSLALVLLLAGIWLRAYTLGHISRSSDAANIELISVYPMTPEAMQHVVALALADSRVEEALRREPYATWDSLRTGQVISNSDARRSPPRQRVPSLRRSARMPCCTR